MKLFLKLYFTSIICLLLISCATQEKITCNEIPTKLILSNPSEKTYFKNLDILENYSLSLQKRCRKFPELKSNRSIDFDSWRQSEKKILKCLPKDTFQTSYWANQNEILKSLERLMNIQEQGLNHLDKIMQMRPTDHQNNK